MKVAITVDAIYSRDHYTEMLEAILSIYKEAEIYAYAHNIGSVIGPIEMRNIRSTFLSHKAGDWSELAKSSYLAPIASKKLSVSCQYDLVISLSRGLAHTFARCEKSKHVAVIYDDYLIEQKQGLGAKVFNAYLKHWSKDKLSKSDLVIFPKHLDKDMSLASGDVKYFDIPVKFDDYQIIPSPSFNYDYLVIELSEITPEELRLLVKLDRKIVCIGTNSQFTHLEIDQLSGVGISFLGEKCAGELAPLFSGSLACYVSPLTGIKVLATGRPVLVKKSHQHSAAIADHQYCHQVGRENIFEQIQKITESTTQAKVDSKACRQSVLKFHETKFKKLMQNLSNI